MPRTIIGSVILRGGPDALRSATLPGVTDELDDLLDGLEGEAREARLALLRELRDDGATMAELRAAVAEDRLALLPVERILRTDPRHTRGELADRAGLTAEQLRRGRASLGLPLADDEGARLYDDTDVEVGEALKAVLDSGVPLEDVEELNRVIARAMLQVAAASRATIAEMMLRSGATERDVGRIAAAAARELVPRMRPTLAYAFEAHLRALLRSDVISASDIATSRPRGAREVAVAFADLVGFTRLGEELPAEELGTVVRRLEALTAEVVAAPVTFVKTLGDAVMLVAPQADVLLDGAAALLEAAAGEGDGFPELRVGLACGTALERAGDWYGSPVNTASRVTTIARPGSILATEGVKEQVGDDGWRWSFAGERKLKGVGPAKLFRARPAGG
jgi:adenylate cyclase